MFTSAPESGYRRWIFPSAVSTIAAVIGLAAYSSGRLADKTVEDAISRGAQSMTTSDASYALVVVDANIHVTPSRTVRGDLWVEDGRITRVGPRGNETRPPQARVIEANGASVVPLLVESSVRARPEGWRDVYDLNPGNTATFVVTRQRVSESAIRQMLIVRPNDLLAVVVSGRVEAWRGEPVRPAETPISDDEADQWHGVWVDESRALEQHLLANGRYTETRNGQTDAYTGRYWVHDGRITYLDDTGFWAFGELLDGVLHHAGFVMHKR
jgi:hypothetical protein